MLRASFFSFQFSGLVQQGMSTSFRVRDFFSFRVFFEVSEHVSTASGDVDCSVRGIFHILIFQISNLFFCEEIVLPMMAFSIFSFEFQLQCRDFGRAVRYHTLSAATFVANRFLAAQLRHAYSLFFLF